jgi:hypothetical protein
VTLAISPLAAYALVFGGVIFMCVLANVLFKPAMRDCPQCGKPVRMDARSCRGCRYSFSNVRLTR